MQHIFVGKNSSIPAGRTLEKYNALLLIIAFYSNSRILNYSTWILSQQNTEFKNLFLLTTIHNRVTSWISTESVLIYILRKKFIFVWLEITL